MKARLNKRTIDEATYQGPGGCYLWDTELTRRDKNTGTPIARTGPWSEFPAPTRAKEVVKLGVHQGRHRWCSLTSGEPQVPIRPIPASSV